MNYFLLFLSLTAFASSHSKPKEQVTPPANPFAAIPATSDRETRLKLFQKIYGVPPTGTDCVRGKPERWVDASHPQVSGAIYHPIAPLAGVEIVTLKSGDEFEILNYGCETLSVGIRHTGSYDKASLKDVKHWFHEAAAQVATIQGMLDKEKGSPFELGLEAKALEAAPKNKKEAIVFGKEFPVDGDGSDFQQARVAVVSVEKIADKKTVMVIVLNRGPL